MSYTSSPPIASPTAPPTTNDQYFWYPKRGPVTLSSFRALGQVLKRHVHKYAK